MQRTMKRAFHIDERWAEPRDVSAAVALAQVGGRIVRGGGASASLPVLVVAHRRGQPVAWGATDWAGRFSLSLPPGDYVLVAREGDAVVAHAHVHAFAGFHWCDLRVGAPAPAPEVRPVAAA